MKLGFAFNAQAIKPADPDGTGNFFPVGMVASVIIKNEVKAVADNKGHQVIFTLKCVHGPAMNQEAAYRLNLMYNNPAEAAKSETTRRIACEQLSAICHVTGVYDLGPECDLDLLTNKPFMAVVESQNDPKYPNSTQIVGVADVNGHKPGKPGEAVRERVAAPPPAPAPSGGWAPPSAAPAQPAFGPASATTAAPAGFAPAAAPAAQQWAAAGAPVPGAAPAAAAPGAPSWATGR